MNIVVINGPNLNTLGQREPEVYGTTTLAEIESSMRSYAERTGVSLDFFQSNSEGAIIDRIQACDGNVAGIIINAGAFSHTSIAIRDALAALRAPIVEVHISNVYRREHFRHVSLLAPVVTGQITGLGWHGYILAIDYLTNRHSGGG